MKRWSDLSGQTTFTLSPETIKVIKKALERELGNADDNYQRATLQKKCDPNWKSRDDQTIDEVVAGYREWVHRTQRALDELQ